MMISVKSTTTDKNLGAKRIKREVKKLDKIYITVGIHEKAGDYPSGESVVNVAFWMEYGTSRVPERSFIRSAINEKIDIITKHRNKYLDDILTGKKTAKKAAEAWGLVISNIVRAKIKRGEFTPNDPVYASWKRRQVGHAKPLQLTGLLMRSINFEVHTK